MKQKDILAIAVIVIVSAVIASIVVSKLFSGTKTHNLKAPVVQVIDSSFPDIAHDKSYQAFFNENALDPTQLIQIGTSQNTEPFNAAP
jgi:hypothetical protein